ncbi:MAG TPA: DUF899 family protein [Patescibacteria group bacterium]|nr:DUF899 family protein [Patescibacteria group bacterium]
METIALTRGEEIQLLQAEIAERQRRLLELKKAQPEPMTKEYFFKDWDGADVSLAELFGERDELILIHNMGKRCSYCTLWADGFNGVWQHLNDRAAFVVVSPDGPDVQREFAESRGWEFVMMSDATQEFTTDMGFAYMQDGMSYVGPGVSTFKRDATGNIKRIAKDEFGPGDNYCSAWYLFDLLEAGAGNWAPRYVYK